MRVSVLLSARRVDLKQELMLIPSDSVLRPGGEG